MATAVQIEITLDDAGVVTGAQRVNSALGSIGKTAQKTGGQSNAVFDQMGKQAKTNEAAVKRLGDAGGAAFKKYLDSEKAASGAAQLLAGQIGIQLPGALEQFIARVPGVSTALKGAFAVTAVIAFAESISQLALHWDELAAKILRGGAAITSMFGSATGELYARQAEMDKLLDPLRMKVLDLGNAAHAAGKQGFAAINEELESAEETLGAIQRQMAAAIGESHKKLFGGGISDEGIKEQEAVAAQFEEMRVYLRYAANQKILALERQHAQEILQADTAAEVVGKSQIEAIHIQLAASLKQIDARRDIDQQERLGLEKAAKEKAANEEIALRRDITVAGLQSIREAEAASAEGVYKIQLDLQAKIAAITQQELKTGVQMEDQRIAARKEAADAIAKIERTLSEDTIEAETRAAIAVLPPWERANAEIVAEAQERIRKIQQLEDIGGIDRVNGERQIDAAIKEENAKMVDEIQSKLENAFQAITSGRIGQFFIEQFEKLVTHMVAVWLAGTSQMQGASHGGFRGFLGNILGAFGIGGRGGSGGSAASTPGAPSAASDAALNYGVGNFDLLGLRGAAAPGGGLQPGSSYDFGHGDSALGGGGAEPSTSGPSGHVEVLNGDGTVMRTPNAGGVIGIGQRIINSGLISSLGPLGASFIGSKIGGTAGSLGLGIAATLGIGAFQSHGALASIASVFQGAPFLGPLAAAAAGGLVGFGVGSGHGYAAGIGSGVATGAALGTLLFPGIGTAIGAIAGLLGGLFGGLFGTSKRRHQAEAYGGQVLPAIQKIEDAYKAHGLGYQDALDQLTKLETDAQAALGGLKGEGKSEYNKIIVPAITRASTDISGIETIRNARAGMLFGVPQFASGVTNFQPEMSPIRVGRDGGLAVIHRGENVTPAGRAHGGDVHIHLHALDGRSVAFALRNGLDRQILAAVRSAVRDGH